MLQLFVESKVAVNPTMKVRWCVDAETLGALQAANRKNPQVLISVYSVKKDNEERYLRPLSELACYMQFRFSGEHRIFATVCWDTIYAKAEDRFLRIQYGKYYTTLLTSSGAELLEGIQDTLEQAMKTVEVDASLFPAKPKDWGWANLILPGYPKDQCALRKRRIFAYTVQPLIACALAAVFLAIMVPTALVTFLIGRMPKWRLISPFSSEAVGGFMASGPTNIYEGQPWYFTKPRYLKLFRPIFPLAALALIGIVSGISGLPFGNSALIILGFGFGLLICALALVGILTFFYKTFFWILELGDKKTQTEREKESARKESARLVKRLAKHEQKQKEEREKRRQEEIRQNEKNALALCAYVNKANPTAVPEKARTTRLMFDGVKRKVCRPYEA